MEFPEVIILRVGESSMAEYSRIQDRMRRSRWVHIDETGFHVEGKKYWLWSFRSAENDVLVVIMDSRGRDIVKETMGGGFPWSRNSGWLEGIFLSHHNTEVLGSPDTGSGCVHEHRTWQGTF